jgi:uncharacterized protein
VKNVVYKDLSYKDITYRILYIDKTDDKPVIFFFHGFGGNRNLGADGRDINLAQMGYTVIVMDAYEHGKRRSVEYERLDNSQRQKLIIDTEIRTAHDAIDLYNFLVRNKVISEYLSLGLYGVSMGGAIVFYLASIFNKVSFVVSIVGSPSFFEFYKYKQSVYGFEQDEEYQKRLDYYKTIDPLINFNKLKGKSVFMSVGLKDKIVPLIYAKELSKKIDCVYQEYDLGHESNPKMLEEAYKFIRENT